MNTKVLVAISGGIDSSLSTILLKETGYEVIAATFRVYDSIRQSCLEKMKGCCSIESIAEAKYFAEKLGINHFILDYRDFFSVTVINNFVEEYQKGRTPNPCVLCNYEIKWGKMLDFARQQGCEYVATGHYARVYKKGERYVLAKGLDVQKDQSYFLWKLTQEQLAATIFPLGNYTKEQVRKMAAERGFLSLSQKRESQEICFVTNNDYRLFLKEYSQQNHSNFKKGLIKTTDGKVVGQHEGIAFYTIGQRKGLGVALGEPYYIVDIRYDTNEIIIGKYEELKSSRFRVGQMNYVSVNGFYNGDEASVKVRYRSKEVPCKIYPISQSLIEVEPLEPLYSVTPGQSAVFYSDDEILAGGVIERT